MMIAFRRLPFTADQLAELFDIATRAGYETRLCAPDALPEPSGLEACEALIGYFPPELLRRLPHLRWVQTPAAGVERLCDDALYCRDDVRLTNCSGAFGVAISEYLMTGLLMLYRHMPAYLRNQRQHIWQHEGDMRTISGSVVTVVGLGDIGDRFARRMHAMGATVRGVRRRPGEKPAYLDALYTADALARAVEGADAVALCLPGTADTRALISDGCLGAMKPDAVLLNVGRGATLDEAALIAALQAGRLGGAVLDVAAVEPLPQDSPLWDMENVIITPHISGHDDDAVNAARIFEIVKGNLIRYVRGEPLSHVVDRKIGY
jgi:phosphoglycerate dehydrogenase-like enzyme